LPTVQSSKRPIRLVRPSAAALPGAPAVGTPARDGTCFEAMAAGTTASNVLVATTAARLAACDPCLGRDKR
jgi:hypothetical protein